MAAFLTHYQGIFSGGKQVNVVDLDVWQGMMTAREIIFSLVPMLCCFFAARVLLHYFQLESYQFPGYFRTLNRNRKHAFLPGICSAAVCLILFTLQNAWYTHALQSPETPPSAAMIWLITLGLLAVAVLAGIGIGKIFSEKHAKKAFVLTGRMRRLMVMLALVLAAFGAHRCRLESVVPLAAVSAAGGCLGRSAGMAHRKGYQ